MLRRSGGWNRRREPRPRLTDRLRAAIGDRLIAWGTRVKAYTAPAEASQ